MQRTRAVRRAARRRTARRRDERGASAIEFALVLPLFMMLVFGIISFGFVFAQELGLSNGARQASRFGVVEGRTCSEIIAEARSAAQTIGMAGSEVDVQVRRGITAGGVDVCGSGGAQPCQGSTPDESLFVSASYTSELMIPLVVIQDVDLEGEGIFRCEYS